MLSGSVSFGFDCKNETISKEIQNMILFVFLDCAADLITVREKYPFPKRTFSSILFIPLAYAC